MRFAAFLGAALAGEDGPQWLPPATLLVGSAVVQAEVADEEKERAVGLMRRDSLPDGGGMLFVYPDARARIFWMKNTPLPLSIAFLDAGGVVVALAEMQPFSTVPVPSGVPAMYALEMRQGWFAAHGVGVGARVTGLPGPSRE